MADQKNQEAQESKSAQQSREAEQKKTQETNQPEVEEARILAEQQQKVNFREREAEARRQFIDSAQADTANRFAPPVFTGDVDNISSEAELELAKAFYQNQPPEANKQQIEANAAMQEGQLRAEARLLAERREQESDLTDQKMRLQSQSHERNKREIEHHAAESRSPSQVEADNKSEAEEQRLRNLRDDEINTEKQKRAQRDDEERQATNQGLEEQRARKAEVVAEEQKAALDKSGATSADKTQESQKDKK